MTRSPRLLLPLCLAMLTGLPACRSGGAAASSDAAPVRRDPRRILPDEVAQARSQNLNSMFDLVLALHSDWINGTSTMTGGHQVTVYLDRARLGGPDQLRTVPLSLVESARYLTPSEAQAEFGLDNLGGAIQIISHHP